MLSPLLRSPEVGRQNDSPAVVAAAKGHCVLVPAVLHGSLACENNMGRRICAVFFAGPHEDLSRLEVECPAVGLGQYLKLLSAAPFPALNVQGGMCSRPILSDERLKVILDALPGPG